jgi:hypothetical protein
MIISLNKIPLNTNNPMLNVRFTTPYDYKQLLDFRTAQFESAKEFDLINPSLLSTQTGQILIIEINNKIVATMQYDLGINKHQLNSQTSARIPSLTHKVLPCYTLTKAATAQEFRKIGLNSYLRLLIIKKAKMLELNALVGTSFENSPRLNLLKEIGYDFYEVTQKDKTYIKSKGKVYFLVLPKEKFNFAIEKLELETLELIQQYNINDMTNIPIALNYQWLKV